MTIDPRYRTFWRRFWAGILDGLLFVPLVWVDDLVLESAPRVVAAIWLVLSESVFLIYSIVLHGRFGKTLGKAALRIRVIDQSEKDRITFRQAFVRDSPWVLFTALYFPLLVPAVFRGDDPYAAELELPGLLLNWAGTLWFLVELLTMLLSQRRRAIHDLLAGSVVVREESIHTSDAIPGAA